MKQKKEMQIKVIFLTVALLFPGFLIIPLFCLFYKSFENGGAITITNYLEVLTGRGLIGVGNSILISVCCAVLSTLLAAFLTVLVSSLITYGAVLCTARSHLPERVKRVIENISLITNTIPGMVVGLAYMLIFSGISLQNTLIFIVVCNEIHYFATPYLIKIWHSRIVPSPKHWDRGTCHNAVACAPILRLFFYSPI